MFVRNYAGRLDIQFNSRLKTEMPDTSDFGLACLPKVGVPIEEEYRLTGNEAYIHIK